MVRRGEQLLEIENFHSIRDPQVLDLRVPANAPQDGHRLANCWRGSEERGPKVVAVFGANGSGKSNLLRVLSFAAWFVAHSFTSSPGSRIPHHPFNDKVSLRTPTRFRFWLSGSNDPSAICLNGSEECPYCYELEIRNGERRTVISEGIFYWPISTGRKTRLIERFEDGSVKASKAFALAGCKRALDSVLRSNASVISTLAQLNHPIAAGIVRSVQRVQSNIYSEKVEPEDGAVLRRYADNPELTARLNQEIQRIDVGVRAIEINRGTNGPEMLFRHDNLAVPMPHVYESHGTRQFVKLFPLIEGSLATGGIAVIDELDAAIHPMLLPEIIGWYHNPLRNPRDAQLWMSCHNASLLEHLSKDEIVLCETDHLGGTELYTLNDIKGVRRDENYCRKYIGGAYGAVPRVG